MIRALLVPIALVLARAAAPAQTVSVYDASRYVLVDARLLRGSICYASFGIGDVDTLPDRRGHGINQRIEARLISGLVKRTKGLVIADALFLDLTLGTLTSGPLHYYDTPESRFSVAMTFGYSFLAGYSTERFGLLAGKRVDCSSAFVGGTMLPGADLMIGTAPWLARLEFRPAFSNEFRLMFTGWDNFNADKRNTGFQLDIPFLPRKRFFLTYALARIAADVSYATFDNDRYATGMFTQHMVGLRFGSLY